MTDSGRERLGRGARAGLRYGTTAFLLAVVSGAVRELFLAPLLGGLAAALLEAAVLAALLPLVARGILDRMPPRQGWEVRAAMAVAGLALVLAGELTLATALDVSGIAEARAPRSVEERAVGLPLLAWLAALPLLLRR